MFSNRLNKSYVQRTRLHLSSSHMISPISCAYCHGPWLIECGFFVFRVFSLENFRSFSVVLVLRHLITRDKCTFGSACSLGYILCIVFCNMPITLGTRNDEIFIGRKNSGEKKEKKEISNRLTEMCTNRVQMKLENVGSTSQSHCHYVMYVCMCVAPVTHIQFAPNCIRHYSISLFNFVTSKWRRTR